MKQNLWLFWYSAIAIAITTTLISRANLDSYSISSAPKDMSPLDATIDSFKSGAARALKATTPNKEEVIAAELAELSTPEPVKQSRFKKFLANFFDPSKKKKTLRNMNFAELEGFKEKCLEANDRYNAIRTLERMVPICTDLEKLKNILLELADLLFEDGKLEAAGKMYREFVKYYPGNEKVEYALYKAVVCKFYVILDAERDQTSTRDAIELANKFLEREEIFNTYSKEVRTMRERCHERLFENEVGIFNFYCDRGRYKSARTRIANIRKEFIPLLPASDPYLLTLEIQLAQQVKDSSLIAEKQKELNERFPTYEHGSIPRANVTLTTAAATPTQLLNEK
jgi:outer membrane assembly lipoprotein YfiO